MVALTDLFSSLVPFSQQMMIAQRSFLITRCTDLELNQRHQRNSLNKQQASELVPFSIFSCHGDGIFRANLRCVFVLDVFCFRELSVAQVVHSVQA